MENNDSLREVLRASLMVPARSARVLCQRGGVDIEYRIALAIHNACLTGDYKARVRVPVDKVNEYQEALSQLGYIVEVQKSMWEIQGVKCQYLYIEWAYS